MSRSCDTGGRAARQREPMLLIAAVLALLWLVFSLWRMASRVAGVPDDFTWDALIAQLGTAVEVVMIVPYFAVAVPAVILIWLAWWLDRRALALMAGILLLIAAVLGLRHGFGMLPGALLGFAGSGSLKRRRSSCGQA